MIYNLEHVFNNIFDGKIKDIVIFYSSVVFISNTPIFVLNVYMV